jgi:hypothetical protein
MIKKTEWAELNSNAFDLYAGCVQSDGIILLCSLVHPDRWQCNSSQYAMTISSYIVSNLLFINHYIWHYEPVNHTASSLLKYIVSKLVYWKLN